MAGEVSSHLANAMVEALDFFDFDREPYMVHFKDPSQLEQRFGRIDWTDFLAFCRDMLSRVGTGPELVPIGQQYLRDQFKTRNAHFYGQFSSWDKLLWVSKHFMARRMIRGYSMDYEKLGHNYFHVIQALDDQLEGDADLLYFFTGVWTGSTRMANFHHQIENLVVSPNRAEADILFDTRDFTSRLVHNPIWCRWKTRVDVRRYQKEARSLDRELEGEVHNLDTAFASSPTSHEVSGIRETPPSPRRPSFWIQPDRAIEELRLLYEEGQQTEQALEVTRNQFRLLFDAVSDALFIFQEGTLLYQNQSADLILGQDHAERNTWIREIYGAGLSSSRFGPRQLRLSSGDLEQRVCLIRSCVQLQIEGSPAYLISASNLTHAFQLSKQLEGVSAQERQRIARDLHDGLSQLLTSLSIQAKATSLKHSDHAGAEGLGEISEQANRCMRLGAKVYREFDQI